MGDVRPGMFEDRPDLDLGPPVREFPVIDKNARDVDIYIPARKNAGLEGP